MMILLLTPIYVRLFVSQFSPMETEVGVQLLNLTGKGIIYQMELVNNTFVTVMSDYLPNVYLRGCSSSLMTMGLA